LPSNESNDNSYVPHGFVPSNAPSPNYVCILPWSWQAYGFDKMAKHSSAPPQPKITSIDGAPGVLKLSDVATCDEVLEMAYLTEGEARHPTFREWERRVIIAAMERAKWPQRGAAEVTYLLFVHAGPEMYYRIPSGKSKIRRLICLEGKRPKYAHLHFGDILLLKDGLDKPQDVAFEMGDQSWDSKIFRRKSWTRTFCIANRAFDVKMNG